MVPTAQEPHCPLESENVRLISNSVYVDINNFFSEQTKK